VWVVSGVVVLVTNAYSDIDMVAEPLEEGFRRKDGTPIA
jgi:hypothetical protein